MAQPLTDRRDIDFVLFEQLNLEELLKNERFAEFNKKTVGLIINEARNLAVKELMPTLMESDQGCEFEGGTVKVPECYQRPWKLFKEGEWIAMVDDPEVGGQGMPNMVFMAASEYFVAANSAFVLYAGLCHGAGKMIELYGTDKQKELYLSNMYSGKWGGSMCLTEPDAGSDVGALKTTAKKNDDGTYTITGNKIFITGGEQNLTENIIHPVLARIEGAPAGTKGISLFLVPKIWVNDDGSLGEPNDVVCTGIEHKMGINGSATCSLTFGGKGQCRGTLLGEENKGMRVMFHMMNEARLGVGHQGFSVGAAAYNLALTYARERIQGKNLLQMMDADAPSVPLIQHPDVRRMLMWMKAYVDGMRSMCYFVGNCFDREETAADEAEKELYKGLIEVMIPIVKSFCTDRGFDVCVQAVQTFGGYGYTRDFPVEQLLRDNKITSIYEGTNGIQAMDLLGRKLAMKKGKYFMALLGEMQKTVAQAKEIEALGDMAAKVEAAANRLGEVAMHLGMTAMSPNVMTAFAYAMPFLDAMGDVILGWMHLWRAVTAAPKLEKLIGGLDEAVRREKAAGNKEAAFYEGVLRTAEYFIQAVLPVCQGRLDAVAATNDAVMAIPETSFGG